MRPRAQKCLECRHRRLARRPDKASSPAKAGDPVSRSVSIEPRSLGILDTPLSRGMTTVDERSRARRRLGGFFSLAPLLRGEGWGEGLLLESGTPSPGATRRPLPASGARLKRTTDVF